MTERRLFETMTFDEAREIVLLAAKAIENEPLSHDQAYWGRDVYGNPVTDSFNGRFVYDIESLVAPSCGTPACIAGHLAWQAKQDFEPGFRGIFTVAKTVLALLGYEDARMKMFRSSISSWPAGRRLRAREVGTPLAAAQWLRDIVDTAAP